MSATRILYVEDEPFLGRIVKESLERRGYEVMMVTHGNEALSQFKKTSPQICVLDIMLPNLDGYAIARLIRQIDSTVPIIFVTAKTQTEDVLKGFEAGGHDYLRKPFSMEELIARINSLVRFTRNEPASGEAFSIGQFEFYPNRYELKQGEQVRKLSHREAVLLKVLAENKNMIVNRKEVLMKVWGDDSFFNSRNLDVYITKLRDYLKGDPRVQIVTIKGIGYRFVIG